jgi:hypothetical protein
MKTHTLPRQARDKREQSRDKTDVLSAGNWTSPQPGYLPLVDVASIKCTNQSFTCASRSGGTDLKLDDEQAVAAAADICSSDLNCSLNGVCLSSGNCQCDKPWHGPQCELLMFKPVTFPQGYGMAPNFTTWGGGAIQDPSTKKYHSFISSMTNDCSLNHWGSNSRVEHGVADSVAGPFKFVDVAIPTWSHNAAPIALRDGTYAIVHIGAGSGAVDGGTNCTCLNQGPGWPPPPADCPQPAPPPPPTPCKLQIPGYKCYMGRCAASTPCTGSHCACGADIVEPKLSCKGTEACAIAAAARCNATPGCDQFTQLGEATKLYSNKSQLVANSDWTAFVKIASSSESAPQPAAHLPDQALHDRKQSAGSSIHVAQSLNGPWIPLEPNTLGGCNNPAPWVHSNGTIFIVCGGEMKRSESISGPWQTVSTFTHAGGPPGQFSCKIKFGARFGVENAEFTKTRSGQPQGSYINLTLFGMKTGSYEDPFLYTDRKGHFQ